MNEKQMDSGKVFNRPLTLYSEADFQVFILHLPASEDNSGYRKAHSEALIKLVKHVFGESGTLQYDEFGKPWPVNSGAAISVTHARSRVAMIVSSEFLPGIDIEVMRPELQKIRSRLLHPSEEEFVNACKDPQWALQVIWGAKEAVYKSYGKKQLIFRKDMIVEPFAEAPDASVTLHLQKNGLERKYKLHATLSDGYYLVFTRGYENI